MPGGNRRSPLPGPGGNLDPKDFEEMLKRFFGPDFRPEKEQFGPTPGGGTGSGFVFDDQGHILTNNHVVDGSEKITVSFNDGTEAAAKVVGTDPKSDVAVIKVESNYNPHAISSKGALGLMQLIPSTARRFGVSDAFDPIQNIQGGAKYLRYLLDLFDGRFPLALAAYNAGEAAVARYGGIPPYAETQNYVQNVLASYTKYRGAATP